MPGASERNTNCLRQHMTIFKLFKLHLTKKSTSLVLLWLFGAVAIGFSVVVPNMVGRLTNLFAAPGVKWVDVQWALIILMGAQVGVAALGYFRDSTRRQLKLHLDNNVSLQFFGHVLRLDAGFFRENEVARINERVLRESLSAVEFYLKGFVETPVQILTLLVVATLMIAEHPLLGACVVLLSLTQAYFALFDKRIQLIIRDMRQAADATQVQTSEVLGGVGELRKHGALDYGLKLIEGKLVESREVGTRLARLQSLFSAISPLLSSVQMVVLYGCGAILCLPGGALAGVAGPMTWGDVIKFMMLAGLFRGPVVFLAQYYLGWRLTRQVILRVDRYLEREAIFEDDKLGAVVDDAPRVVFDDVQVELPSKVRLLEDICLDIAPATHVALAGPAGCGKSTLLSLICREMSPSEGQVSLDGVDVEGHGPVSIARTVGFVTQKPVLFSGSIRDNLLLSLRRPSSKVLEDRSGPLDASALGGDMDGAALDERLLSVVRSVGFEADVLHKFLDRSLGDIGEVAVWRRGGAKLRKRSRAAVASENAPVALFTREGKIVGTVLENLLGPGARLRDGEVELGPLAEELEGTPLRQTLLRLGLRFYAADRQLAAARQQSAGRPLPGLSVADLDHDLPSDEQTAKLSELPTESRDALLKVALGADMVRADRIWSEEDLGAVLVASRDQLESHPASTWKALEEHELIESLSMRDNLVGGRAVADLHGAARLVDELIRKELEAAGLLDAALLGGLDFQVGDGGRSLSGGQRQKVALARVLMKDPDVLLLDEATASLDELSQNKVIKVVDEQFADKTVVSISHRLSTVRNCDQIVVLDRGRVSQRGTYDVLAKQQGLFREMLGIEDTAATDEDEREPIVGTTDEPGAVAHALARCSMFADMDSAELALLDRIASRMRCDEGHLLFERGDVGEELFIVLSGQVEFFASVDGGQERVVQTSGPGQVFGELAIFGEGRRTLSARAKSPVELCVIAKEPMLELIRAVPDVAIDLMRAMSVRQSATTHEALGKLALT